LNIYFFQNRVLYPLRVAICCKILDHVIYSSVSNHLTSFNILCDVPQKELQNTFNFYSERFCQVFKFKSDILLLDFRKAFEKVPYSCLYLKPQHYGINGSILSWIKSFLTRRSQYIVQESKQVLSGVPQGTVLAPLLFLLYINDLHACVNDKVKL